MPDSTFTVTKDDTTILHDSRPTSYGDEPLFLALEAVDDKQAREQLHKQITDDNQEPNGEVNLRAGDTWKATAGGYTITITAH